MPHYIVHVGPHKTGSSYLQTCLLAHTAALRRAGFELASQWNDSTFNPSHVGLVQRLNSERLAELKPIFAAWRMSACKGVIISCEDLASMSREPVKVLMLRELTEGCPVTIVYYVRRWSSLLSSEWQEYIKQGSTLTLPEVLVHTLRDTTASRIVNIDACLSTYAGLFGGSALRLVSYDHVIGDDIDLFAHFSAHMLDGFTPDVTSRRLVNVSLSPAQTELMRLFNCLEQQTAVPSRGLLPYVQLQHPPAAIQHLLDHIGRFATTIDVHDDDAGARDVLLANRRAYAASVVPPVGQDRFYAAAATQIAYVKPDYALAPGFAPALRRTWQDLLALENAHARPGR